MGKYDSSKFDNSSSQLFTLAAFKKGIEEVLKRPLEPDSLPPISMEKYKEFQKLGLIDDDGRWNFRKLDSITWTDKP